MKQINNILGVSTALGSALFSIAALAQTAAPAAAPAAAPTPEFTGKVAVYSEYEYRGISQTSEKPALQLNLDYANASGFYLGTFVSNIKWLKDAAKASGFSTSAQLEVDIYSGFKTEIAKDVTLDVGVLAYIYPSSGSFSPKPNTTEIYAGVTSGAFNVKYSHAVTNTFGNTNSKGSGFIEANWTQEIAPKLTANAQLARQVIKNGGVFSYTVYKAGLTYDLGDGWSAIGYFKGTNAKKGAYEFLSKDWSKSRLVIGVSKSF
jgi:uncharacterized protein (TIGR02001 family)